MSVEYLNVDKLQEYDFLSQSCYDLIENGDGKSRELALHTFIYLAPEEIAEFIESANHMKIRYVNGYRRLLVLLLRLDETLSSSFRWLDFDMCENGLVPIRQLGDTERKIIEKNRNISINLALKLINIAYDNNRTHTKKLLSGMRIK
jgi:hypothetical protein